MKKSSSERLIATIRAELARRGFNQRDVAGALGITQQAVSRRMSGHVDFTVGELSGVAALLGVTLSELVTERTEAVSS